MRYFKSEEDAHKLRMITEWRILLKSEELGRISMEMTSAGLNHTEIKCGSSQAMLMLSGVLAELVETVEKDGSGLSAVEFINIVADYAEMELETRKNE